MKCKECGKEYQVSPCRKKKTKYCSRLCAQAGIARRPVTWGAKIGAKTKFNKRPDLAEYNRKHPRKGKKNHMWKGDKVGYYPLHMWMKRKYGKPDVCEECGSTRFVQWANKSGKYLRKRSDWLWLCAKCHCRRDRSKKNIRRSAVK